MLGQNHHFNHYAPQPVPYAIERYQVETCHLYAVLNTQLRRHAYVAGADYSIADMAIYPGLPPTPASASIWPITLPSVAGSMPFRHVRPPSVPTGSPGPDPRRRLPPPVRYVTIQDRL